MGVCPEVAGLSLQQNARADEWAKEFEQQQQQQQGTDLSVSQVWLTFFLQGVSQVKAFFV